jgi:hypothetical protein
MKIECPYLFSQETKRRTINMCLLKTALNPPNTPPASCLLTQSQKDAAIRSGNSNYKNPENSPPSLCYLAIILANSRNVGILGQPYDFKQ